MQCSVEAQVNRDLERLYDELFLEESSYVDRKIRVPKVTCQDEEVISDIQWGQRKFAFSYRPLDWGENLRDVVIHTTGLRPKPRARGQKRNKS